MKKFFIKYKEIILYLIFGGLTTLVGIGTFWLFSDVLHLHELIANAISWVIAVLFAFFTNRIWVFDSGTKTKKAFIIQLLLFAAGRLFTLGAETGLMAIFVTWLKLPDLPVKIVLQVIVIILNYVISKFVAFRKKKTEKAQVLDENGQPIEGEKSVEETEAEDLSEEQINIEENVIDEVKETEDGEGE